MFTVVKALNNNVVMAYDEKNVECIVVGKGIGFSKKSGDILNEKIEKVYYLQEKANVVKFSELLNNIRDDIIGISEELIAYAENMKGKKLNEHIHIALPDHIAFAIERIKGGIDIKNPFNQEISALYKDDYKIALRAIDLINDRLNIRLPEDEAGFIALHLHAAFENSGVSVTMKNTRLVSELVKNIEDMIGRKIETDSIDYLRLITHLKFAIDRIERGMPISNELLVPIKRKFKKAYKIATNVAKLIGNSLDKDVPEDEIGYLAIHIQRLINEE
ncbi:glucose PTS transporter transcription antiterminator GlcT [Thermoanaerobacterium thermosaccharolyticum]|uniref:Transcriptional antiterminator n=1 Tax=Thermoanaerobacterium thermosaccharolyticum M0795 TaxID=698948 RepID=L0IMA0_THETR|nr:PRD domain-containing protein [Thermoanaerobacterium thermosaccharolyticum]AGB19879.1 transcriptional antiterminator [Thermoanaerobacterium thermosaccharolyticum M0795]